MGMNATKSGDVCDLLAGVSDGTERPDMGELVHASNLLDWFVDESLAGIDDFAWRRRSRELLGLVDQAYGLLTVW